MVSPAAEQQRTSDARAWQFDDNKVRNWLNWCGEAQRHVHVVAAVELATDVRRIGAHTIEADQRLVAMARRATPAPANSSGATWPSWFVQRHDFLHLTHGNVSRASSRLVCNGPWPNSPAVVGACGRRRRQRQEERQASKEFMPFTGRQCLVIFGPDKENGTLTPAAVAVGRNCFTDARAYVRFAEWTLYGNTLLQAMSLLTPSTPSATRITSGPRRSLSNADRNVHVVAEPVAIRPAAWDVPHCRRVLEWCCAVSPPKMPRRE
jgi:hypothetical protein